MNTPSVSVLLPVRDEAAYLGDALESLSQQTFDDFEVVVVDDGSVDESAEVAESHASRDGRFRLVRQRRRGIVHALERARAEARGRFLARMDGDDVALPHRLAAQVEALESERLDACGGGIAYFPDAVVKNGARRYQAWINSLVTVAEARRDIFVECPLPHPTVVVPAAVVAGVGGYVDRGWAEDYDLVLRIWAAGGRFRNVETVVLRWREHERRASRRDAAYSVAAFVRCKVHHLRATLLRGWSSAVIWGAGPVGKSFARELLRCGVPVAAFVDVDPRKLGHTVAGAPVVAVDEATRFADSLALGAVAGADARARVREMAAAQGRRDGVDFVAVA